MKYDAFISYRHLPRDMYVAKGVHKALETARIPRKIQQLTGRKRIQRVFRDQEELPIGADLGENIESALMESGFLVVICTPQTKESAWVMKEINTFIAMHGRGHILAVLADGEPYESFPQQILVDDYGNPVEPLAADVRGNSLSEIKKKISSESLRLIAAILGVDYDDLKQRHRERMMRRYITIAASVAVLGIAFGAYNAYNLKRINENYQQKLINESRVLAQTAEDILGEGDRKTAALVAMEALPQKEGERPVVADAVFALSDALGCYRMGNSISSNLLLTHKTAVKDEDCNIEGTYVASYDNFNNYYIWDAVSGKLLANDITDYVDYEKDEIRAVAMGKDTAFFVSKNYIFAVNTEGEKLYNIPLKAKCYDAFFSPDCSRVIVSTKKTAYVYELSDGDIVAEFEETSGDSFFDVMTFSEDLNTFAISHMNTAVVTVCDITTGQQMNIDIWAPIVEGLHITNDGGLVVASVTKDDLTEYKPIPMMVQKFDCKTGLPLFEKEYTLDNSVFCSPYMNICSRTFSDSQGTYEQLFVAARASLYTLDLKTGELINKFASPDGTVTGLQILPNDHDIYVCTYNGYVYCFNPTIGEVPQSYQFVVGENIDHMDVAQGRMISSSDSSTGVRVLTYRKDPKLVDVDKLEDVLTSAVYKSPGEKTYLICTYINDDRDDTKAFLYDAATDERLATFEVPNAFYTMAYYLDEDTIVFCGYTGNISYYTISTGELEELDKPSEGLYVNSAVSKSGNYRVLYDWDSLLIYDVLKKEKVIEGPVLDGTGDGDILKSVAISDDGTVYFSIESGELCRIDPESRKIEVIIEECFANEIKLSSDGKFLLFRCSDGYLKVYDVDKKEIVEKIEFFGSDFVSFFDMSKDNTKVYLQGNDSYFKIYDRKIRDFVYEGNTDTNMVSEINEDLENNRLIVFSYSFMHIIDMDSYGVLSRFEKGCVYLPKENKAILFDDGELCRANIRSYQELIKEAKERYGEDAALTPSQKRKYNIG